MASGPGGTSGTNNQNVNYSSTVAAATENLISVLTQNLSQGQLQTAQGGRQEQGPSSVEQEMARSFPGLFVRKSCLGKRKSQNTKLHGPSSSKIWKPFGFYVYLLNRNAETTPTSSEEIELSQAGLGKRHLTMRSDMSHEEVFGLLENEFPKMKGVTGGWLLYKATGGQGRRKLTLIPPDSEGYTGTLIRSVSGAGKNTLYVVPLQQEFDLTPLPADAVEFQNMPKAQCQTCKVSLPLQILALHVQECLEIESSETEVETCDNNFQVASWAATPAHNAASDNEKLPCPVCYLKFSPQFLEMHASSCGERFEDDSLTDEMASLENKGETPETPVKSIDDILDTISQRVDVDNEFNIQISRTNLLERGLLQWKRQKRNSPSAALKVSFFGEAGVDTGALRKEFLTDMLAGIELRFFEGQQHHKSPRYSLTDFDNGLYRIVGEILAVSLAQGGPAPTFFSPWAYRYLCNGQMDAAALDSDAVTDVNLRSLLNQVESSTEQNIEGLSDEILNCGFTGTISVSNKDAIIRAIKLHAVLRLQPMMEQLREGLQLYGLLELVMQHPDICQPLFVSGGESEVDAQFVMAAIRPQLSEKGSTRHQVELDILNHIQDLLYKSEENPEHIDGEDEPRSLTPAKFLQWITGQGHAPLLPSEKKDFAVTVKFNHDCSEDFGNHSICFPVVSACVNTIVLPAKHMSSYDQFKANLMEAFLLGQEFHKV